VIVSSCKIPYSRCWLCGAVMAFAILVFSTMSWAQGCAMCYNSAAAARASAIHALKQGIVVLLAPPLAMFIGIFALAFRRRYRFNGDQSPDNLETQQRERATLVPSAKLATLATNDRGLSPESSSQECQIGV